MEYLSGIMTPSVLASQTFSVVRFNSVFILSTELQVSAKLYLIPCKYVFNWIVCTSTIIMGTCLGQRIARARTGALNRSS